MEESPLFIGVISALIGAIVSYIGTVLQNALKVQSKIDENLRNTRIEVYRILWEHTKLLPKWPKSNQVTYEKLFQLSNSLQEWYFDKGGMYLSTEARK